jgi:hypothetical protein
MSQVVRYRQYWMATLKERHVCQICGDIAIYAKYLDDGRSGPREVKWLCGVCNDLDHQIPEQLPHTQFGP